MTDERRAEILALAEAAQCATCDGSGSIVLERGPVGEVLLDDCPICSGKGFTLQDVPGLVATVRELLEENERLEQQNAAWSIDQRRKARSCC